MRAIAFLAFLSGLGCAGFDPWGESARTSPLPSRFFAPEPPEAAPREEPGAFKGRTLTLAECIAVALERNPRTRSSWQAARAAAARVGGERAAYLPTADFVAGAARSNTADLRDKGTSPRTDRSAGFGVRYVLFDGGARDARVQGAGAELLAANFRHNATLLDVAHVVDLAYAERLAAKALVRVAEETVRQSQVHVDLARARLRSGVAPKFDVLKAETEKADADLTLVKARGAARVAQGRLCQAMGLRVSETFEIEDLPEDSSKQELADIDLLLEEAAKSRPELRAAVEQIEARRADVRATEAEYFPVLTAGMDYGWRDKDFPSARSEWTAGVGVSFSLFDGFGREYRAGRARAELARAAAEHDNLLKGVELEVWTEYSRATEAGEAVEAARKFVASAEESARVAEGMYRNGAGSIIEMVDSLAARTAARTRLVQANLDLHAATARFERAVGRTLAGNR